MYDTREEFNQKLVGCVVMYGNTPVYLSDTSGKNGRDKIVLHFTNLKDKTQGQAIASDPAWDFRSLGSRLGYANLNLGDGSYQQALFLSRIALRQSQKCQGLSRHNVRYSPLKGSARLNLPSTKLSFEQLQEMKGFLDTLERKYPTLTDVAGDMTKNPFLYSKAFNSRFAVNRPDVGPFYMEYRGKNIGYSEDFYRWKISPEFDHLKENLEHIQVNIA